MFSNFRSLNTKKVALVADKPNWAYDAIAKALLKFNTKNNIKLEIIYVKDKNYSFRQLYRQYDLIFFIGWQLLASIRNDIFTQNNFFFDKKRTITGIHSHHSWDGRRTTPENDVIPPKKLINFLNSLSGVNAVSRKLYEIFLGSGLKNIIYTPNGVDTNVFLHKTISPNDKTLNVGFSGSSKHDWRKGTSELIIPSCKVEGVNLKIASPANGSQVLPEDMPNFYKDIDLYICASLSEGFSLSVLEASATGCPVISSKVGGCEDLITDGFNGFLVDRNVSDFMDKVIFFKKNRESLIDMGINNRKHIEQHWNWEIRSKAWLSFIESRL